ncbi:MAG: hypothetical protein ACXABF_14900, partial [Candidatus Thorarchaeota archaeon]|jgi:hypothetical protein
VNQVFDWAWTAELRVTGPFSRVVNTHSFPFGDGLYRITKKCMLTDVYIRDEGRKVGVNVQCYILSDKNFLARARMFIRFFRVNRMVRV